MKQIPSGKCTVAWFKLAECVSRGEKERALGVYRLLSHSLDDFALACQLKGDIFLAFGDMKDAITYYYQAAQLYKRENRTLEEVAIYEHLLTMQPEDKKYRTVIIHLYNKLNIHLKVKEHTTMLINYLLKKNQVKEITYIIENAEPQVRTVIAQAYDEIKTKK